jgi:F-type H+-transporting ATPase subunit gamma
MSGATEGLVRKIAAARDLRMVVRSMKALAASNIGQYERAVAALHDYYRTVNLAVRACRSAAALPSRVKAAAGAHPVGAVIFGSDQGLVGRFNEVLMEFVERTLSALTGRPARVWAVGERMQALAADAGRDPRPIAVPNSVDTIAAVVGQILLEIAQAQEEGAVQEVYVFHNAPKSAALYEPVARRLLPLDERWQAEIATVVWPTPRVPQVIQSRSLALESFVREYLFALLFQACAESLASENASRLAAMQRAERNIEEVIEDMNRRFHRIRQESIDEELFEVISGYDSLARD